jgi:hypothetical protein
MNSVGKKVYDDHMVLPEVDRWGEDGEGGSKTSSNEASN